MDAAPDLLVGQQPEPALDLVEPGGAGGCEMGLPARPFGEPVADRLGLVGTVVVHDDVDVEISRDVRLDESRNLRNSRARWRGKHLPMISPVAMSRAAKREVVPWRL